MDIRIQRTRSMLREALKDLLEEKTLDEISVSEICERSTVRRATFYRHFSDKYALYEWSMNEGMREFLADLEENDTADDVEVYTYNMHIKLIDYFGSSKNLIKNTLGERSSITVLDMLMRTIADGIAVRVETYAQKHGCTITGSSMFAGDFYSSGMVHTLRAWYNDRLDCTKEELAEWCTQFLLRYIAADASASRTDDAVHEAEAPKKDTKAAA